MNEQAFFESCEKELTNHLAARHEKNGGTINMMEVIDEAVYCLAVNVLITKRNIQQPSVPQETIKVMFDAIEQALNNTFPNNFDDNHFELIKIQYHELLDNDSVKNKINEHYDDLYGSEGGNVI